MSLFCFKKKKRKAQFLFREGEGTENVISMANKAVENDLTNKAVENGERRRRRRRRLPAFEELEGSEVHGMDGDSETLESCWAFGFANYVSLRN